MVSNEREYRVTQAALEDIEDAIFTFDVLSLVKRGIDPLIANSQLTGLKREAEELRAQLAAYDALVDTSVTRVEGASVAELGKQLVSARIAKGWTQRQLAQAAGMPEQQVQRYEKSLYEAVSLKKLDYISKALGAVFNSQLSISRPSEGVQEFVGINPSIFPISEMNKKNWFGKIYDIRNLTSQNKRELIGNFFVQSGAYDKIFALHRKSEMPENRKRDAALMVWQAKLCFEGRARAESVPDFRSLDSDFLHSLVKLSPRPDGIRQAIAALQEKGVIVAVLPRLDGTKLEGAAIALDSRKALIGLTVRNNRIDNFWYNLLHEVSHIHLHWPILLQGGPLLDEEELDMSSTVEAEADKFARNCLIPDEVWNRSFVRYTNSDDEVRSFAGRIGIHPAIVAGRIRYERNNCRLFSKLIGQGEVKDQVASVAVGE